MKRTVVVMVLAAAISLFAQSEGAYDFGGSASAPGSVNAGDEPLPVGLLDPSRFSISHSMSFMAGGSRVSDVKSQSLYSTMMQYKFNAPVVLSLNFDMPIHSTFNQYSNLTEDNLSSMDYFRNMPIDASVTWMPSERFMMRVSVLKLPEHGPFHHGSFYRPERYYRGW